MLESKMEDETTQFKVAPSQEKNDTSGIKKKFWRINRQMLPLKLHFFLFESGMGTILPYQSAFGITNLGFTASNLAAAYTIQQVIFTVLNPGIGYLADYFNRLKATIVGLTVLQAIVYFFMLIIPNADMPAFNQLQSNTSYTDLHVCHFCWNQEEFNMVPSTDNLHEDTFSRIFSCFNNSEVELSMHCSNDYFNSNYSLKITYEIVQKTCNNSLSAKLLPINDTALTSSFEYNVLFIKLLSNNFQHSKICLMPKRELLYSDFPYNNTKMSCFELSHSIAIELQKSFLVSPSQVVDCNNWKQSNLIRLENEHNDDLSDANFKTYQYWMYVVCLILSCTCISAIFTLSDTACYESEGGDYGRQRMWGTVGWGLAAPFAGFLNDYTESYMSAWCLMVFFCSLQIWNLSKMNLTKPDFSRNILKDLKAIYSSMEFLAFQIGVFMNGMCTGVVFYYLVWFLTSIGANKLIIGLAYSVQSFMGELPIMFVSTWMIQKFGHFNLVSLAIISHGIRFFFYSYIHNPWWILPVECLHGFTYGSFYAAMTAYAKLSAKSGIEATTQSVLFTTFEGLGGGIGCVISGICFEHFGGHTTFFYTSFLCAVATLLNMLFTVFFRCHTDAVDDIKTTSEMKALKTIE